MPPKAVPPDNKSFALQLKTIVKSPEHIAIALKVQNDTAQRIHGGLSLILESTRQASQLANTEAAAAVERSEVTNQALLSAEDVLNTHADYLTTLRINMNALEEFTDQQGGARMWVANFVTAYVSNHAPTMAEVLDGLNLDRLQTAAKDFMKVERVLALIGALLAALPVPILQYILDYAPLEDFTTAAKSTKRNRLSLVVDALLKATKRW